MKKKNHNRILFNRASVKKAERISCNICQEQVVFSLKDKQNNSFSVGLTTILNCLSFAIEQGELPKLPRSWCSDVEHCLKISFDDEISYYDYSNFEERRNE